MKAQTVTKLNNLLNMGRVKSKYEDRSHHDTIEYVTSDHIACVTVTNGDGDDIKRFDGGNEVDSLFISKIINTAHSNFKRARFVRSYLVEILSNMDSDFVTLYMDDETPILIEGKTEDNIVQGAIAPIIGDEEQ